MRRAGAVDADRQVLAPFAFVSNLAGVLLAMELARFNGGEPGAARTNYIMVSPSAPPHRRSRIHRGRVLDCEFCGQPHTLAMLKQVWPEIA